MPKKQHGCCQDQQVRCIESCYPEGRKRFPDASPFQYFSVGETSVSKDWKVSEQVDFKETEKIDHYSVQMKGKNSSYEALYDAEGKLLMSKKVEKDVALPQPVAQAVAKDYHGVTLKKDQHTKLTEHGSMKDYYVISLANGKKVTYNADGTAIKK